MEVEKDSDSFTRSWQVYVKAECAAASAAQISS